MTSLWASMLHLFWRIIVSQQYVVLLGAPEKCLLDLSLDSSFFLGFFSAAKPDRQTKVIRALTLISPGVLSRY